jgi:hypothetical protein
MIARGIAPSSEREFCSHPNPPKRPRSMRGASKPISGYIPGGGPGIVRAALGEALVYYFFSRRKFGPRASVSRPVHRWCISILIQCKDRGVQHRGERHPGRIRHEQPRRHAVPPPRRGDEGEDGGEHQQDHDECEADVVGAKENRCP